MLFRLSLFVCMLTGCDALRALVIDHYPQDYASEVSAPVTASAQGESTRHQWPEGIPAFTGNDTARKHVAIHLEPALTGLREPTDLVFFPGSSTEGFVTEKGGVLHRFSIETDTLVPLTQIEVLTQSEQGLLGVALHPDFSDNGRFYIHASLSQNGTPVSEISAWRTTDGGVQKQGPVLDLVQPYGNHNAGKLAFGPDGMLYIAFGDGGWRDDPHENGQNGQTWLGSILRIDVDHTTQSQAYAVPKDNPWLGDPGVANEVWAMGLRNPWKFSFAPDGRMIVADVGQNAWEEVSLVQAKDNLGWNTREASHCFIEGSSCSSAGLVDPIFEYGRDEGKSITGGYVATNNSIAAIQDHYIFADFVSGRLWAIPLPDKQGGTLVEAKALGQWPFLPSTFAQSADGTIYVAGFGEGTLYRIEPD